MPRSPSTCARPAVKFAITPLPESRASSVGLRHLQDLLLLAMLVDCSWTAVCQAAQALHDHELIAVVAACQAETKQARLPNHPAQSRRSQALLVAK